ncbi:excinuclease ABC subunit C [Cryobacterium mesophilum]|uniref:UvrABC system protein C n=1 Tax=Terrimesophilobacter mesophilus TaxID=433647 RepID=A0A4R8VAE7_9MICO|nr:excinuclease ABC subunit UvrC [Terrimesophilobacter mesophilus]MBB5631923.1 excinuclease ABC subunit C [Terrimesophilobacter mesophilus]TFB78827.1 excinuclease ABC subunit UvrC [Terrimesophilobacter mesophilus]
MTTTVSYRPRTGEIPTSPGVYRFRDAAGRILYVGKAKNLRARLSNYFAPLSSLHERTRRMVTTANSVEWTVVGSEFEALQLEFSWIKEFNPPFNVQFRDDKSYPYLAITLADDVPRVLITRNRSISGARYFGPYTKVWAIRETLDLLLKVFPMRSCSDATYRRAEQTGRPCLLGEIGKCAAPCVGRISKEDHKSVALDLASFMSGNDVKFTADLTRRMKEASERFDYESAATYRDQLAAIETVLSKNTIVLPDTVDADLFGLAHDELAAAIQLFSVRGGRIRGVRSWVVDKELDLAEPELVETVVHNAYQQSAGRGSDGEKAITPPKLVVVPTLPEDSAELERLLSELRAAGGHRGRVTMRVAQRGDLAQLAETVNRNAQSALASYKTRRSGDFVARSQALSDIQEALGMGDAPLRMECFDVSHLGGTNIVASMVVFEDGLPRKDQYRRFSIPESTDDTESIYQTLSRRLARLDDERSARDERDERDVDETEDAAPRRRFAYRPNLLIVDGGQPQVQAAERALRDAGIPTDGPGSIALCGIAKRLEEIWLPHSEYPVILPRNSDALFLFQRIRDEAHRFAITYQRLKRKTDITSVLTAIPGLGPARVRDLLRHFGSVAQLRRASPEAIAEVRGIGPTIAIAIHDRLAPSASGDG